MAAVIRANAARITYFLVGALLIWGEPTHAAADTAFSTPLVDDAFIFKSVLSGLLGILIWVARGQNDRLKEAEKLLNAFSQINATRTEKIMTIERQIEQIDKQITLLEHEHKQTLSIIAMERELRITNYQTKEDTEKHRLHVEEALKAICHRLDHFVRPAHRVTDDK